MEHDPELPLLLPDTFRSVFLGTTNASNDESHYRNLDKTSPVTTTTNDWGSALCYSQLIQSHQNSNQRKYISGSRHRNIFPRYFEINAVAKDVDVVLEHAHPELGKQTTTIKIRSAALEDDTLHHAVELGDKAFEIEPSGNCRKNSGDGGEMCGLGHRRSEDEETCVVSREAKEEMKRVTKAVGALARKHFPEFVESAQRAEREKSPILLYSFNLLQAIPSSKDPLGLVG